MIVLAVEEFAARRRSAQERIENALRPVIERALDGTVNTDGYAELIDEVRAQWRTAYADEAGSIRGHIPGDFIDAVRTTLAKTDRVNSNSVTVDRIATWLATAILSHSTIQSAQDDPEELFLEWVDMNDDKVRHTHAVADGQQRPIGEPFLVGGEKMPYPGYPGVSIELWINCRCTVRPVLASEALVASGYCAPSQTEYGLSDAEFKDYTDKQRKNAHTLPDGSFPIEDCADLKNAIQAIGRAKDPAKAKAHIRSQKNRLGCPEVSLPDTWAAELAGQVEDPIDGEPIDSGQSGDASSPVTHAGLAVQAADTGRILLQQRSLDQNDAPEVQGTWEFPGGGIEDGETPEEAAMREFCEETGCEVPEGEMTGGWTNGNYQGHVMTVPMERDAMKAMDNPPQEMAVKQTKVQPRPALHTPEARAWFSLQQAQGMGGNLRPEMHNTPWDQFSVGGGDHHYSGGQSEEDSMPEMASKKMPKKRAACTIEPLHEDLVGEAYCIHEGCGEPATLSVSFSDPDWYGSYCDEHGPQHEDDPLPEFDAYVESLTEAIVSDLGPVPTPGHGVLTVEGKWTGDGRRFSEGSLRSRPLPLPLGWQRSSDDGHKHSVTVYKIDRMERVGNEIRYSGNFIDNEESGEVQALIAEFGRFGVSVDADDVTMGMEDDENGVTFTDARSCGGSIVAIPAFHEAYIALGPAPEDFFDGGEALDSGGESMVASIEEFVDIAPGKTEDGPGWLTNYIPTDRLRDWWASQESGVGWGTPGDFNRCRAKAAQYIKPQYLAGFCANRHYDALGFWPGQEGSAMDNAKFAGEDAAEALSLVAAAYGNIKAPADWFGMAEPDIPRGVPLTITEDGQVYGHVATWKAKHGNSAQYGTDRNPPKSPTNYSHFLLGGVLLDNGETVPAGCLTIGGGHAPGHMRLREAQRHYDDSTTAFADVHVIDGKHGIWACGWVRPGTPEEMVVAARASKLSGDWRKTPQGTWEMIAALAVNAPGFMIPRIASGFSAGEQVSLVASNVVASETIDVPAGFDYDALANGITKRIMDRFDAREKMKALRQREFGKVEV